MKLIPKKYTKEVLEPLVASSKSIREICIKLGLRGRGGKTSNTISKIIKEEGLDTSHFSRSKYSEADLRGAVAISTSMYEVMRRLGLKFLAGGTHAHLTKKIARLGIDTSHFLGIRSNLGKSFKKDTDLTKQLTLREEGGRLRSNIIRKALLATGVPYQCGECERGPEWNGRLLTLPVDHINGNPLDNRRENLRFLCPNCHSQTATFCRKNR